MPEERQERVRLRRGTATQTRSWGEMLSSFLTNIWIVIKTVITLGGNIAPVGNEQQDFGSGEAILNDDRLLASLNARQDMKFFKGCNFCRKKKKPFLLLVITNPDDQQQIDTAIRAIAENQIAIHLITHKYVLMVVSKEQLEANLKSSEQYFKINENDAITMFVMFVKHQQNISIVQRLSERCMLDQDRFVNSLHEYIGLYSIVAEEDPEYRQIQILQDAGIIPVTQQEEEGRNPGVSTNIPQEAIDFMMREHPVEPGQIDQFQRERNFDRHDFARNPAIVDPRGSQTGFGANAMNARFGIPNSDTRQQNSIDRSGSIEGLLNKEGEALATSELPEIKKQKTPFPEIVLEDEPTQGSEDAVEIVLRLPSGEKEKRRFRKTSLIQSLYTFVDHLQKEGKCIFEHQEEEGEYCPDFKIIQSFPRKVYD
mmetsp:Transcript_976/g.1746  ORF Transcript_976/g.1746 Transcript_976/m.1746 type:complete len:426 (+) Transcript_976:527-1804(+)